MKSPQNKNKVELVERQVEIIVVTPWVAPLLSPVKQSKSLQIQQLKNCYKIYGIDDEKTIEHLDRAFERDMYCNVLLNPKVISGGFRDAGYQNAIFQGNMIIPKDEVLQKIIITVNFVNKSVSIQEEILPATVIKATLRTNISPGTYEISVGARKFAGKGKLIVNIK